MSKYTGSGTREGDWLVFCARGHTCWASEAFRTSCGTLLCTAHWEPCTEDLEQFPDSVIDDSRVDVVRGQDIAQASEFKSGVCPHHSAVAGVAIAGCMIAGRSGAGGAADPDANKPGTFTVDTGTISLA